MVYLRKYRNYLNWSTKSSFFFGLIHVVFFIGRIASDLIRLDKNQTLRRDHPGALNLPLYLSFLNKKGSNYCDSIRTLCKFFRNTRFLLSRRQSVSLLSTLQIKILCKGGHRERSHWRNGMVSVTFISPHSWDTHLICIHSMCYLHHLCWEK